MLLKLYKWFHPSKEVIVFDRYNLPIAGDSITVGGLTAVFGKEPTIFVTDDRSINPRHFEEEYRDKGGGGVILLQKDTGKEFLQIK